MVLKMSIGHENEVVNAKMQLSSKRVVASSRFTAFTAVSLSIMQRQIQLTKLMASELIAHKLIILSSALVPSFKLAFMQFIFNHQQLNAI